ncbi:MAG TPA: hypothetical protein VIY69_02130, partial [Candidatus Acidoferrales bacterium]
DCAVRLEQSKYGDAEKNLLTTVWGVAELMVTANFNSQAKLIHSLPPPQSNRPIVVNVQSPYQPTSAPNHCTGSLFSFGSSSTIDWNCGP